MHYNDYYRYNESRYDYDEPEFYDIRITANNNNNNNTATINEDIYSYPENFSNAIALIEEAIAGEEEDRLFYTYLINNAPTAEDRQIISGIRDNELRHHSLFLKLYSELTGQTAPQLPGERFVPPSSYCEGLQRSIIGEESAVAKYRQILFAMQNRVHINMLTEIITDEIRHGILYTYLYSKNNCNI
ncbi:ferritin family protein [Lachnoclostridium phytofermentans]|uniref:Rubrerythrin n=1 Tax=Lachnoclostridium phytofermentans (strain ATCC 700394 / DSM 18823 / ISDg) TaxID=357809 RepID=A9KP05_LACP7|nr:ferritin-like domain-containing protein [Lachnoclostridium phytofermentans]ABX43175.1 Rubrerythrin [Lachnoclostridium phytofermentans ISDg]